MSYYQNNLKAVKYNNIKEFLDKLESEGKEDWQIRQAYKAIKVFLEDFMCLLIDFTEDIIYGFGGLTYTVYPISLMAECDNIHEKEWNRR